MTILFILLTVYICGALYVLADDSDRTETFSDRLRFALAWPLFYLMAMLWSDE